MLPKLSIEQRATIADIEKWYIAMSPLFFELKDGNISRENGQYKTIPLLHPIKGIMELMYRIRLSLSDGKARFLDIGCGVGNIVYLAQEFGYDAYGLEINSLIPSIKLDNPIYYADAYDAQRDYYEQFDVIYMYQPVATYDKWGQFLDHVVTNIRSGAIIILIGTSTHLVNDPRIEIIPREGTMYEPKYAPWYFIKK